MKSGFLIFLISTFSVIATAEQSADGKIRQGNGVARATAELAAMDLVQVCLGMPLIQAGAVTFDGIENLKFTPSPDGSGSTFAYAKCVYKPTSK
jgi:hypothetical protein